jgi:hypothetical protein
MTGPLAQHCIPIDVVDPLGGGRVAEPVEFCLAFDRVRPHRHGIAVTDRNGQRVLAQITAWHDGTDSAPGSARLCLPVSLAPGEVRRRYIVWLSDTPVEAAQEGIRVLDPQLADGYRRLDTGCYELELCTGTARGNGASKWGIRHFEHTDQRINLIAGNANAFGGVYGPFFTPENGLINPPAHAVARFHVICEGPVTCQYRMKVDVPDGLRPELRGKTIEVIWRFYHGTPLFTRTYFVDDFDTEIDGRRCANRITVGDEIESGKSNLMLSTYRHKGGTAYREGDLYAEILLARLRDLQAREPDALALAMDRLGIDPAQDPSTWHWDNYWRLFCAAEQALPPEVLEAEVERIWRSANETVWSDRDHTHVHHTDDAVDVNKVPQQTIFALNAQKTCEYSPRTGYAFVRYMNHASPRMQIVQRYDSGWVNWGTNGENEYPELPSGSTIWAAYDRFDDWEAVADRMETPLAVSERPLERSYDVSS